MMIRLMDFLLLSVVLPSIRSQHTKTSANSVALHQSLAKVIPCKNSNGTRSYCLPAERCRILPKNFDRHDKFYPCDFNEKSAHVCCPIGDVINTRLKRTAVTDIRSRPKRRRTYSDRDQTRRQPSGARGMQRASYQINPPGCGKRIERRPQRRSLLVAGGETVNQTDAWPWMIAIRLKTKSNGTRFLCGGTLITRRHVLTTAHCFGRRSQTRSLSDYVIVLGSYKQSNEETSLYTNTNDERIKIAMPSALKIHDGFKYPANEHDIAVITLDAAIVTNSVINPVCLPSGSQLRKDVGPVTVIGWGGLEFGGEESEALQQVTFKIIPLSRCRQLFREIPGFKESITRNVICAGDIKSQKDACKGDSGGPLLWANEESEEEEWIQLGIVAFGHRCAEKGLPGLYVRVASYIPWIQRIIERTSP